MADEMLLAGAPVVPRKLEETSFAFRWPDLKPALKHMFGR
jgi:NAD dependent epimerase/dehydratase family enzyme